MTRNFASLAIYLVALMTLNSGLTVDVQQSKVSLRDWIPLTETEALKYLTTHELAVVWQYYDIFCGDNLHELYFCHRFITAHSQAHLIPNRHSMLGHRRVTAI